MELIKEIRGQLPVPFYPNLDLCLTLSQKGLEIFPEKELMVTEVLDGGDEGGIMCVIEAENKENFVISITNLRAKPGHPLAGKISEYQRRRLRKIFRSRGLSRRVR